jgi:hypothetical protein
MTIAALAEIGFLRADNLASLPKWTLTSGTVRRGSGSTRRHARADQVRRFENKTRDRNNAVVGGLVRQRSQLRRSQGPKLKPLVLRPRPCSGS